MPPMTSPIHWALGSEPSSWPDLKSFMTSPVRPEATATMQAMYTAWVTSRLQATLAMAMTKMPKTSMGLMPDWPTHWEDMAVVSHTPSRVMMTATMGRSRTKM